MRGRGPSRPFENVTLLVRPELLKCVGIPRKTNPSMPKGTLATLNGFHRASSLKRAKVPGRPRCRGRYSRHGI